MKNLKKFENVISDHYKIIGYYTVYPEKITAESFIGPIKNVAAFIEVLGKMKAGELIDDLKKSGFMVAAIGLDIYVIEKP